MSNTDKKIAVVTGASRGLGLNLVLELLRDGYQVYGISKSNPNVDDGMFKWINTDLRMPDSISGISKVIREEKIDLLVNNAGVTYRNNEVNSDQKKIQEVLGVNLIAPVLITNSLFQKLISGLIINISSIMSILPVKDFALYNSSKSGLNTYFKNFAIDNPGIKVINLLPDMMNTLMLQNLLGNTFEDYDKVLQVDTVTKTITQIIHKNEFKSGDNVVLTNNWLRRTDKDFESSNLIYNVDRQLAI